MEGFAFSFSGLYWHAIIIVEEEVRELGLGGVLMFEC